MASKTPAYAWMNGEVIPWENARIHVHTDAVRYGANVFEGIRGYASPDKQQVYVFRNPEHMDRLYNSSMKILRMQLQWSAEDLTRGILEMLRANDVHEDVHIRPLVYFGGGEAYSFDPSKIEVGCSIVGIERPPKESLWKGISARVSSWRRIDDETMPPRVKAGANYLNSRYAMMDARIDGYDTAIIMNQRGKVAEGPGACLMMVRQGKVVAPPVTEGILESITRATLIDLFGQEMGMEVVEREVDRTELYIADEVFFCGTGSEVQPITSIDRYPVGSGETGPVVKGMQDVYFNIARGQNPSYTHWLTPVY
jgi:branched-chain amino acid aminotransferase